MTSADARRQPQYGTILRSAAPELVEVLAGGGLDFLLVDHMHSALSWETTAAIARAARAAGLHAFYRPNGAPETGEAPVYLAAQCNRALSVGFDGLFVSVRDERDAAAVIGVADRFWQRNLHAAADFGDDVEAYRKAIRDNLFVIAQFESIASLDHLERVAAIEGLDGLAVANSDLSIEATGGLDAEDDRVLQIVGRVSEVCHEHRLALWCNTGYGFPTASSMAERAHRLVERGADLVLLQSAELILANAIRGITQGTSEHPSQPGR